MLRNALAIALSRGDFATGTKSIVFIGDKILRSKVPRSYVCRYVIFSVGVFLGFGSIYARCVRGVDRRRLLVCRRFGRGRPSVRESIGSLFSSF